MDLRAALPRLLPKAIEWARKQEEIAEKTGSPLGGNQVEVARRVGVQQPDSVRIVSVDRLPQPDDPELQEAARQTGLLGPAMVGLTLGYAIFIVRGHETLRLVSHEYRHVYQYEQCGSIDDFLLNYLGQIVAHGYRNAPFEIDARNHEIHELC